MKLNFLFCLNLLLAMAASAEPAAPAKTAPIPMGQIGAVAGKQYQGDGMAVTTTPEGARLRCAFQKLEGQATSEGLWLSSIAEGAKGAQFRVVATAVGRSAGLESAFAEGTSKASHRPALLAHSGQVEVSDQTARFIRAGVTEEYSVSVDGVRQDFVVTERPDGTGQLRMELDVTGAKAEPLANGARLTLDRSGRKIAYNRLRVTDATGKELTARMEVAAVGLPPAAAKLAILVEDVAAMYPVRIDPTFSDANWYSMGGTPSVSCLNVLATAVDGMGNLYVGGNFTTMGGIAASHIAKWDGSAWSALGSGVDSNVQAMVVSGTNLYAGGIFTNAGGISANCIARWNGNAWSSLGSGMNGLVESLAILGTNLYAGGGFSTAGGVSASCIARWNGSTWSALGGGLNGYAISMAVSDTNLYVGGSFYTVYGYGSCNRIAKWNGSTWSALGAGLDAPVYAVAVLDTNLYVGGIFANAGGAPASLVAKWNGTAWSALGTGIGGSQVNALTVTGTNLYVGGSFTNVGGSAVSCIAKWDGSAWSPLGSGLNATAAAMTTSGTNLYAGGYFNLAGGKTCAHVARADITSFGFTSFGIAVFRNGVAIADGGSQDFGSVSLGANTDLVFTITNTGNVALTGLSIGFDGPNSSEFTLGSSPIAPLNPGYSTTFTVRFAPISLGAKTAVFHIANNTPDHNPFNISITGLAVTPSLQAPAITSATNTTFIVGALGGFAVTATGYPAPTFSLTSGSLPSGLTLAGDGSLAGTAAAGSAGSYPMTITANNGVSPNATQNFTVFVNLPLGTPSQEAKLMASDGAASDYFGWEVSLSADGNTALLGAMNDDTAAGADAGSAYVFVRTGNIWLQQAKLTAGDGAAGDYFGYSVSLSGDGNTAVVGAIHHNTTGGTSAGSAYVFVRSGSSWSQQAELTASDGAANDDFGFSTSVSGDGNTTILGAYLDDTSAGIDAGSAYVFVRDGTNWSQQTKLTASDGAASDNLGHSVSLDWSGNTALVGANLDDTAAGADAGSVYVFVRNGNSWNQQAKLTANDAGVNNWFGCSVNLSTNGNTALVGAIHDSRTGGVWSGSAYVFERSGNNWKQQAKLSASDGSSYSYFGESVKISGDGRTALVGAGGATVAGRGVGSAYAFVRSGTNWSQQAKLAASDGAQADGFGFSIGLSGNGNLALIGAGMDDTAAGTDAGSAYVFLLRAPEISVQQPAGTDLVDGSSTVGYGSVNLGTNGARTFVISSLGTVDLTDLAITVDGVNPSEFAVTTSPAAPVVPGGSTTFAVTFTPGALGTRSAALHIANNDADENPFDINLAGTGVDTTPPSITCPGNFSFVTDAGSTSKSNVTFVPSVTDNGVVTNVSCSPPSGSSFPAGITSVACLATDGGGNTASCNFIVLVRLGSATNDSVNVLTPDGTPVGMLSTLNVSTPMGYITDVNVTLNISGSYNGDLYAYLVHESGFAVLLNRPGRSLGSPYGYGDAGFNVTLDDQATNGDIHLYRDVTMPSGALTGAWAPDGRDSSPFEVLDIDPRPAENRLGVFNGMNPNGAWTLFVADTSSGGLNTLVSWGLVIQGTYPLPTITCPANVNVGADSGQCYATGVSLGTPTVTGQGVTVTNNAPAQFSIGATVVTWTVTDVYSNVVTCPQLVTVTAPGPQPGSHAVGTMANTPQTMPVLKMLANDTHPLGKAMQLTGVTASGLGSAVSVSTNNGEVIITYTPPPDYIGSDSFTYTNTDACGVSAVGTVAVTVTASGSFFNLVSIDSASVGANTVVTVVARGIPGGSYALQRAAALSASAAWSDLQTRTPGSSGTNFGVVVFTLTNPPSPSYYRTRTP